MHPQQHCTCDECRKARTTSDTPGLDELRALNHQLTRLLAGPEPGLVTWRETLRNTLMRMADFAGLGRVSAFGDLLAACKRIREFCESNPIEDWCGCDEPGPCAFHDVLAAIAQATGDQNS